MPELPGNWAKARVGEVLSLANGFAFKPSHWQQSGLPIIRIQNLNNPRAPFNYSTAKIPDRFRVNTGDLLFAWSGTPGTSFGAHIWKGSKAWLNQHIFNVRFSKELFDIRFLQLAINQNLAEYISAAHGGAGLAHITKGKFEDSTLLVAPLTEQRRIVGEIEKQFSRLDDAVKALKRVQANLKRHRASVLKAGCEGRLVPTEAELARKENRTYEHASELLKRILAERRAKWEADQLKKMIATGKPPKSNEWKNKYSSPTVPDFSILPLLPEGWTLASVEQVSWRAQYGSSAKCAESGEIPVLRMGNLTSDGELVLENWKFLPAKHDEFPELLLRENDLLFNRTNSAELVGKSAVFKGVPDPCSFASYLIRVSMFRDCEPDYVAACLNSSLGKNWIKSVVNQQVGQANVNGSKLQAFVFPLPPRNEQIRIVAALRICNERNSMISDAVKREMLRTIRLRQSILSRAFSGKLVPQDPNDEPASALLERVLAERAALAIKKENQSAKSKAKTTNGQRRRRIVKLGPGLSPGKRSKTKASAVGVAQKTT